jgi:hypothetical protein
MGTILPAIIPVIHRLNVHLSIPMEPHAGEEDDGEIVAGARIHPKNARSQPLIVPLRPLNNSIFNL